MAVQPALQRLKSTLLASGLQSKDPTLYQVIDKILDAITQLQNATSEEINTTIITVLTDIQNQSFLTATDETLKLPNSRELLAGIGITFDDSIANERTVNAIAVDTQWSVLSDGNLIEPELIYAGGEVIMLHIP